MNVYYTISILSMAKPQKKWKFTFFLALLKVIGLAAGCRHDLSDLLPVAVIILEEVQFITATVLDLLNQVLD